MRDVALELVLRRDRMVVLAALGALAVLAWAVRTVARHRHG